MGFFEKNSDTAKKLHTFAPEILQTLPEPPPAEETSSGLITVKINGRQLATSVDPKAEGDKFAKSVKVGKKRKALIYGLGLAYHIESMLSAHPNLEQVVVIEANRDIISAAFHHRDLRELLSQKRFTLVTGIDDIGISTTLAQLLGNEDDWAVAIHHPSYRNIPKQFDRLRTAFEILLSERRFKSVLGTRDEMNIRSNLKAVASAPGVSLVFNRLKGRPAIVVGAGPSLDKNLPLLNLLKESAFILAADTAIHPLLNNGIKIDAVISVDPQPLSVIHFGNENRGIPLIFAPTTHPLIVDEHKNRRMVVIKEGHSIFKSAEQLVKEKGMVNAGGSVSCFALELLAKAGADPIGFIGQDFSFPDGRPYNIKTMQMLSHASPEEIFSGTAASSMVNSNDNLKVELYNGKSGVTHANLLGYLKNFEETISAHPEKRFFNINSSGAVVNGAVNLASTAEIAGYFYGEKNIDFDFHLEQEKEDRELAEKLEKTIFPS